MQGSSSNVATVNFFTKFTSSEQFEKVFREGMSLVEETANYLDGPGRLDARVLERHGAIAYATESMRLTTRLMQLASWLLLHRAVKEGEMTLTQANREKTKVKLSAADPGPDDMIEKLPIQLQELIGRSMALQSNGTPSAAIIRQPFLRSCSTCRHSATAFAASRDAKANRFAPE